jgi:hypothetical protein
MFVRVELLYGTLELREGEKGKENDRVSAIS